MLAPQTQTRARERVHAPPETPHNAPARTSGRACTCIDCGAGFVASGVTARFCSDRCRFAFDNRRKQRGAILYDLFMIMRYQRDLAKTLKIWGLMCRAANDWRDDDNQDRQGRRSWHDAKTALDRLTHLFATVLVRGRK